MSVKYLDLARTGKNQWWRYLLAMLFIVFFGLVIGSIPIVSLMFLVNADNNPQTQLDPQTSQFEGVEPLSIYLAINLGYVVLLTALYVATRFIHQRKFITLITPRSTVRWQRIAQGFSVYFLLVALATVIEAIIFPGIYKLTFNIGKFFTFLPAALILTPIQASMEELFFRGYLMQAISLKTREVVMPIFVTSLVTMFVHLANPEVALGPVPVAVYYFGLGLFLSIITIKDNTLELAIGVHTANNLFVALVANYANSSLPSPSVFTSQQLNPMFNLSSFVVVALSSYVFLFRTRNPSKLSN